MVVDALLKEQTHSKEEGAPGQAPGVKDRFPEGEGLRYPWAASLPAAAKRAVCSFAVNH